jgi:transcriptional regulator with XRE-family HTH domain
MIKKNSNLLGNVIKERRKELGITQEKLAIKMGVKQEYISALENGKKKNPSSKTIGKIAHALGLFQEDLLISLINDDELHETNHREKINYTNEKVIKLNEEEINLINNFRNLSPTLKGIVLTIINSLEKTVLK